MKRRLDLNRYKHQLRKGCHNKRKRLLYLSIRFCFKPRVIVFFQHSCILRKHLPTFPLLFQFFPWCVHEIKWMILSKFTDINGPAKVNVGRASVVLGSISWNTAYFTSAPSDSSIQTIVRFCILLYTIYWLFPARYHFRPEELSCSDKVNNTCYKIITHIDTAYCCCSMRVHTYWPTSQILRQFIHVQKMHMHLISAW